MTTLRVLLCLVFLAGSVREANAAKKKHPAPRHRAPAAAPAAASTSDADDSAGNTAPEAGADAKPAVERHATAKKAGVKSVSAESTSEEATSEKPAGGKQGLDFDFFGGQPGEGGQPTEASKAAAADAEAKGHTRRWMLRTHQILGIHTWVLMTGTVIVGQLNYNELYGGGSGDRKWQSPHRVLVLSTSVAFAATAAFAIFAPNPYPKPLHFDTGLVHRIAVIGATLGMVAEGVLGWTATHQADAGNPNHLRTMARAHQIVGYTTLGFLTVAGTVWLF